MHMLNPSLSLSPIHIVLLTLTNMQSPLPETGDVLRFSRAADRIPLPRAVLNPNPDPDRASSFFDNMKALGAPGLDSREKDLYTLDRPFTLEVSLESDGYVS